MPEIETNIQNTETEHSIRGLFDRLQALDPKVIDSFVPSNAKEQKALFLIDQQRVPEHIYGKLDQANFAETANAIREAGNALLEHPDLDPKYVPVYQAFTAKYLTNNTFKELASGINHAPDASTKQQLADQYMQLNIEINGAPEHATYRSLLSERINAFSALDFGDKGRQLYDELRMLVPTDPEASSQDRFAPKPETVAWMKGVVEGLYAGMLSHIPEQGMFEDTEIKTILEAILESEFTDQESGISSAEGWQVIIEESLGLKVTASEKKIIIPEGKKLSAAVLRRRVVHEVGIHMLRSVTGEQSDLDPLSKGLNDYYDVEEGLGMVMEQALNGKAAEAGIDHYITAGLAYFGGKDFRDTFEIKWRIAALSKLKPGEDIDDAAIEKARSVAYGQVMRSFRGTDEYPWFKDLAYYNGVKEVWSHLDDIAGDDLQLSLLLMGKASPTADHRRSILESRTP